MATSSAHIALGGAVCCSSRSTSSSPSPSSSSLSSLQKFGLSTRTLPRDGGSCNGVRRNGSSKLYHTSKSVAERRRWMRKFDRIGGWSVRAEAGSGSSAMVAKEMERVAAKEALILSIRDAGGLKGLTDPVAYDKAKIDVNEKILTLERLNPTPRPTTSPVLEGLWQFEWADARSPGIVAARTLLGRIPPALASIDSLTLLILDGSAQARGFLKIFNTVESSFTLFTKLTVEGPLRLKEEYVEGLVATPKVPEGSMPAQFKGVFDQLVSAIERLPDTIKEALNSGVKIPLSGMFSRELLISYLDEEVMVARDKSGVADVLLRLESPIMDSSTDVIVPEYMS
ncbi:unnamed protein product [Calypogeia fissa]